MRTPLSARPFALAALLLAACLGALLLSACDVEDPETGLPGAARVEFSAGSPPVEGQSVDYSGSLLSTPSLDKFRLAMVFRVKADNSRNSGRAAFGSDAVRPILNFRIGSRASVPVATPIPPFSIAGGAVEELEFPVEVPLTLIDRDVARRIVDGDPVPYFLSGTLQFQLLDGNVPSGAGQSELDLASGEIATRPSGRVAELLSGLL